MTKQQTELLEEIVDFGKNPVCWHILGQGLVDQLCAVIREQSYKIRELQADLNKQNHPQ